MAPRRPFRLRPWMGAALLGVVGSTLLLTRPPAARGPVRDPRGPTADASAGVLPDLSSVNDAARLGDGWVLVDSRERTLHVADSLGNLRRQIGRRGQGPGEFQYPRLVGVTATHLYVAQLGHPELSEFDHEGRFVRPIRPTAPCGIGAPELLAATATDLVVLRRCSEPPRRIRLQLERLIDGELRPWGHTDTIPMPSSGQMPISFPVLAMDGQRVLLGDGSDGCLRRIDLDSGTASAPSCLTWIPRRATPDSVREQLKAQGRGRLQVPDSLPRFLRLASHGGRLAILAPEVHDRVQWMQLADSAGQQRLTPLGPPTSGGGYLSQHTLLIVTDTDDGIRLEVIRVQP